MLYITNRGMNLSGKRCYKITGYLTVVDVSCHAMLDNKIRPQGAFILITDATRIRTLVT